MSNPAPDATGNCAPRDWKPAGRELKLDMNGVGQWKTYLVRKAVATGSEVSSRWTRGPGEWLAVWV